MTFPYTLPTTSHVSIPAHFSSSTHPSLPTTASSHRNVLRNALKSHKRLAHSQQASNLSTIQSSIESYLPYLFALESGLSNVAISGESIEVSPKSNFSVEWRATLTTTPIPSAEPPRIKGTTLSYEVHSVLQTLATTYSLLARNSLLTLYAPTPPSQESRTSALLTAIKHLLTAHSLHTYLQTHSPSTPFPPASVSLTPTVQTALSSLTLSLATLLTVLKDDPYPPLLHSQLRKNSTDYLIGAPSIPKVRAHLFARLCIAASDHAARAVASLAAEPKVISDLKAYAEDLRRVAKAKACRFLGIDADLAGNTGEGIAWLRAAKYTLNPSSVPSSSTSSSTDPSSVSSGGGKEHRKFFSRDKFSTPFSSSSTSSDKLPDPNSPTWGLDAGKTEESLLLNWLEQKWAKMNDTVNVQLVPDFQGLLGKVPSGREVHESSRVWRPVGLGGEELRALKGPMTMLMAGEVEGGDEESSGEEEEEEEGRRGGRGGVVGAFPGTGEEYGRGSGTPGYY
ncbi:MAG: hypothetical protein Q9227_004226 [Pyrenula ochraceoflavens]